VNTHRRGRKALALAAVAAFVLAACGSDDGGSEGEGAENTTDGTATEGTATEGTDAPVEGGEGGTLIWAHEQEPPDLYLNDPENNLTITSWINQGLLEGLYGITGSTEFFPELLAEDAVLEETADGASATFTLRDGLTWSDGTPLTANDVKFTYDVIMAADGEDEEGNPAYVYLIGDRTGYDTITNFEVISDTEFKIDWSAPFSGYKTLFSFVFPSHVFSDDPVTAAGEMEALRTWTLADGTVIPSSGPLVFDSWEKGVQMNLVRNDNYHGSVSPDAQNQGAPAIVDGVQINWVTDTDAQVNALKAGEANIIMTQPQLQFEELATDENFTVASLAGPVFEHWGLNLFNSHLAKPEVREALALAMNKSEVMEGLYTPLFGDLLPAEGLGNTYWMSNQPAYVDHQGGAGYGQGDIDGAKAKLEEAGYTLNGDGIYEHPEDGVLSLRVGTTGGNRLREVQQELLQAQFGDAGIEVTINNGDGGAYFGDQPFNEEALACANSGGTEGNCDIWDITQFAWVGGPWPGSQSAAYRTGAGNNAYGYANEAFDAKADECDQTTDPAAAADCYNELDRYVTTLELDPEGGLFMIPITQKPSFYAYTGLAQGAVAPDANDAGPLANVVDYQFPS
jgi:peptide/nickel transport system substrate-binding protein